MSWNHIKDNEEVGVWFNTELIWILQGKPRNENEMLSLGGSGKTDNEALRIINNPKTTLKYLNETDNDENTRRTALAVACGGLTDGAMEYRLPSFKIIRALLKRGVDVKIRPGLRSRHTRAKDAFEVLFDGFGPGGEGEEIPQDIIQLFYKNGERHPYVLEQMKATKIQSKFRGNKSRLTSKAEGRITKKQLEADWLSLKRKMQASGFKPEQIERFHRDHYMASLKKKKRRSSKKKKKSKGRKRKSKL